MVRPADEVSTDLAVRAVSLPAIEALLVSTGTVRVVNLESFDQVPVPEDGLLLAIHANDGPLPEDDAKRFRALLEGTIEALGDAARRRREVITPPELLEAGNIRRALEEPPVGLVAVGLVSGYAYAGEHGRGTEEPGAYAPWLIELQEVEPFSRPVLSPGWPGIYKLPEALELQIARAWVSRGS